MDRNPKHPLDRPTYSQRERSARYGELLKPALLPVARELGFRVGRYSPEYNYTVLLAKDPSNILHSVCLNWKPCNKHGIPTIHAELTTRERKASNATDWGMIVNAICHGVPDAWGDSDPESTSLLAMVRSALDAAIANLNQKQERDKAA
jgi:hypothetical protein